MDSALWLLLWLALPRLAAPSGCATPARRAAPCSSSAGLLFFALVVGPQRRLRFFQAEDPASTTPRSTARAQVGPLMLFAYCLLTVLFASAEQGVSFTPAEVQFLFTGPFSRRQAVGLQDGRQRPLCCLYALFLTAFFFAYAEPAFCGLPWPVIDALVHPVIQHGGVAAHQHGWRSRRQSAAKNPGGAAHRPRVWGVLHVGGDALASGPGDVLNRLPAERRCPDPADADALVCGHVHGRSSLARLRAGRGAAAWRSMRLLLLLVFLLDAQYLEAAAAASERSLRPHAARAQRRRRGCRRRHRPAAPSPAAACRAGAASARWRGDS